MIPEDVYLQKMFVLTNPQSQKEKKPNSHQLMQKQQQRGQQEQKHEKQQQHKVKAEAEPGRERGQHVVRLNAPKATDTATLPRKRSIRIPLRNSLWIQAEICRSILDVGFTNIAISDIGVGDQDNSNIVSPANVVASSGFGKSANDLDASIANTIATDDTLSDNAITLENSISDIVFNVSSVENANANSSIDNSLKLSLHKHALSEQKVRMRMRKAGNTFESKILDYLKSYGVRVLQETDLEEWQTKVSSKALATPDFVFLDDVRYDV
jgi:hypothetical protein